jgi:cation transport regulator ChaB
MSYESIKDLPKTLRDTMPREALEIYLESYKEALDAYEEEEGGQAGREAVAHRDAMHAVKREFVHDDDTHKWYRKGQAPTEEETKEEGIIDRLKDLI